MARYDYIVVGGGSAGCAAAGTLAEDTSRRVLLLECGEPAEQNPETLRADGYKDAFKNDRVIWERFSERQKDCANQRLFMGSGKGMGGSGAVNGMVYTRGAREDYAAWGQGWQWEDVVPHFEDLESRLRPNQRPQTELTERCIQAAVDAGFRRSEDLNDGDLSGVLGYEWMNYEDDQRRNSYVAFVKEPARENLEVRTGARTHRVLFDGRRATGVEFEVDGALQRAEIDVERGGEVLLCAGALESPKLLQLSGVGPGDALRELGIEVALDLPEVGQGLHDHPNVTLFFRGEREVDFNYPQLYGFHRANADSDLPAGQSDTCYVFYPARSSLHEAMVRMLPTLVLPQPLYKQRPLVNGVRAGVNFAFGRKALQRQVQRIYGIVVILGKPKSRGQLGLSSADPSAAARLDPQWFSVAEDLDTLVLGVERARNIAAQPSLAEWGNAELWPGQGTQGREKIARWVRKNAMTTYHYAGTCRMGAVVDPQLRVLGLEGLRVADAAAVPETPVSAMNAPSMLVGLRAARFIQAAQKGRAAA